MRILVTGGAGFIGSNFVHRTLATRPNDTITVLDALTYAANPDNLTGTDAELVVGDIRDEGLVDKLIARSDVVVHCAAESHNDRSLHDPMAFVRTNVEGTLVIAEAAARHGVHLHHISTDEVFGDLALDDPTRFTTETPYRPSSPYSASKASADHFVRALVRSRGLKATISNCSNNYGPRQHPEKFVPRQIISRLTGSKPKLYGQGHNVRDWIHVDDHNDAVWQIIERGTPGRTYLIGADGERSNLEVIGAINQAFGADASDFETVPDRPGHDLRYAIDPSSTRDLGWRPQHADFAEGLAQTINWYRDNDNFWRASFQESEAAYRARAAKT